MTHSGAPCACAGTRVQRILVLERDAPGASGIGLRVGCAEFAVDLVPDVDAALAAARQQPPDLVLVHRDVARDAGDVDVVSILADDPLTAHASIFVAGAAPRAQPGAHGPLPDSLALAELLLRLESVAA